MLIKRFIGHVLFQAVSAVERRNSIASWAIEYRAATEDERERQGWDVSQQTTRTQKPRSFGERTRDETLETRRKSAMQGGPGGGGRRREGGKDGTVAGCGGQKTGVAG